MNVLEKLIFYWNYPFVRYALIVGVLIALCSSLLGVTLVLKRFSYIGDGVIRLGGATAGQQGQGHDHCQKQSKYSFHHSILLFSVGGTAGDTISPVLLF